MAQRDPTRPELEFPDQAHSVGAFELFLTVFVTGFAVMTIEIVGTRVIGPVFGVGLFVLEAARPCARATCPRHSFSCLISALRRRNESALRSARGAIER